MILQKELEFRGIPLKHIEMYLQELGGVRSSDSLPILYHGQKWSVTIVSEEEISFTSVFKVNAIKMIFKAETDEVLEDVIRKYRKKTFRAGG